MMKHFLGTGLVAVIALALVSADDPTRLFSQPSVPSREALDRLNLQVGWSAYVSMDGRRDGFINIQVNGGQIIAQTRSGLTTVLDAETGRTLWRARPGRAYKQPIRPAFNSKSVFASDGMNIYALDRATGTQQWEYAIPTALATDPVADERRIYLCTMLSRVVALRLPAVGGPALPAPPPAGDEKKPDEKKPETPGVAVVRQVDVGAVTKLEVDWDATSALRLDYPPPSSRDGLLIVNPTGELQGLAKAPREMVADEVFHVKGTGPLSAPPGQSEETAYLGLQDAHVYAIGINSGKIRWRYIPGTPLVRKPVAVPVVDGERADLDVYLTADGKGLARLNGDTGEPLWSIRKNDFAPEADRILGVNPKFVYATDGVGRLLVLDRKNGNQLSRFDVHDFAFPVTNEESDRFYLASNDGLIVCLHDKDYREPLAYHAGGGTPLVDRAGDVKKKLAAPISDPGAADPIPLNAYLDNLKKQYNLKIQISDAAFKELNVPAPGDKPVLPPKVDKMPLGQVLQQVLDQVNATYVQAEDVILIAPAKPKGP